MAKQTINIGAAPNDGTGTPLRTSFDYCNQNFTELYTATGPSGNNIVVPGSATITGAATVGTTLGVTGVTTLTGNAFANGSATVAAGTPGAFANAALTINNRGGVGDLSLIALGYRPNGTVLNGAGYIGFITTSGSGNVLGDLIFGTRSVTTDTAPTERYRIDSTGISTWSVAGSTAMTLNSTGLGVGVTPSLWGSGSKALQIGGGSASVSSTGAGSTASRFAHGAYFDNTNWIYQNSSVGAALYQVTGANAGSTHAWYTSAGGTAGDTITDFATAKMTLDASGNLLVGTTSGTYHTIRKNVASDAGNVVFEIQGTGGGTSSIYYSVSGYAANAAHAASKFGRDGTTLRSINAGGTINASGADYAEYMVKCGDFVLAKGDVAGIDANGKLTNVFADAVSFVVKSTDPSYVGNDKWGVDLEGDALEAARQLVDRIAFAGQVPVNVTGAKAGDYIVPVVNGTGIKGISVSNPTFEQYKLAVGKVIAIDADGRARIIVKVA
jgi:hypothetical protein